MILADQLQNMQDLLAALERESDPERVMVKYMSGETVVEKKAPEFFGNIDRYAGRLTAEGLTDGHIGIIGPNCYEWLVSFGAVLRLGAVAVLMAAYESPEEISDDILRTDIRAVLYAPSVKERLEQTGWMGKIPFVPFFGKRDAQAVGKSCGKQEKSGRSGVHLLHVGDERREKSGSAFEPFPDRRSVQQRSRTPVQSAAGGSSVSSFIGF